MLKVYKKHNNTNIRHEPKGRRPTYQANQGPVMRRTSPNPKQTVSNWRQPPIGSIKKPTWGHRPKLGTFGSSWGGAAPLVRPHPHPYQAQSASNFAGCLLPSLYGRLWVYGGNFNMEESGFLVLWGDHGIFQGSTPSSPPIKGGSPPHTKTNTQGRSTPHLSITPRA
jgi:hypothetical protein